MNQNTKKIFKYAGIGFLAGFIWFGILFWWLHWPEQGEGAIFIVLAPAWVIFGFNLSRFWLYFVAAGLGWSILGIVGAEIILIIKLLIKKVLNKIKEG